MRARGFVVALIARTRLAPVLADLARGILNLLAAAGDIGTHPSIVLQPASAKPQAAKSNPVQYFMFAPTEMVAGSGVD